MSKRKIYNLSLTYLGIGVLTVHFERAVVMPRIDRAMTQQSLHRLADILSSDQTDLDKKNWLMMICQDIYCTTKQVQHGHINNNC